MNIKELAIKLDGELVLENDKQASTHLTGVSPIEDGYEGSVSFLSTSEYSKYVSSTKASCLLVSKSFPDAPCAQIVVKDPYACFALTTQIFYKPTHSFSGISDKAMISRNAVVSDEATVYAGAFIDEGASIAKGAVIYPGVFIGKNAKVGENSVLRANVVLEYECIVGHNCLIHNGATIGADGFGFTPFKGEMIKIAQTGNVVIEDNVEIGGGSNIDRATMGSTVIGQGSKLDSYLHIAHNAKVGKHNLLCGGVGLAGSCSTGDYVVLGGGVSVANHVHIGTGVRVGAQSVITKTIEEPGDYCGYPAIPMKEWRKQIVNIRSIDKIKERLSKVEVKITTDM